MKKIIISIGLFLAILAIEVSAQSADMPTGNGSSDDPYQIATLNNLYWVTQNSSSWSSHFIQTADIDAMSTTSWNGGKGFSPIGNNSTYFTGTYDGQNHTIDGLFIDDPNPVATFPSHGMFGYTENAYIENLGLTNVDISAEENVGGLVGLALGYDSKISNCFVTGSVIGWLTNIGGLVGRTSGNNPGSIVISNSYANCYVEGNQTFGGLVGDLDDTDVFYCFSKGTVIDEDTSLTNVDSDAGGLVGNTGGCNIENSYSHANVYGNDNVGGLVGIVYQTDVDNSYSKGVVSGEDAVGGLFGINYVSSSFFVENFWDIDSSGVDSSFYGTGKSTAQMKTTSTFKNAGWTFGFPGWSRSDDLNDGYPYLYWQEFTGETVNVNSIVSDSVFVVNGLNAGFQSQSSTVDVEFELMDSEPPNFPSGGVYIGNYWDIIAVNGGNVKLRLYYLPTDTVDFSGTPTIFHYNGSNWVELATSSEMTDGDWRYVETNNYFSSFSPVTIGDGANPLPVELISFEGIASEEGVVLSWETATEVNNYGFQVQRKKEKAQSENPWGDIGFVQGNGTVNSSNSYSFEDDDLPSVNKVSYRLKQIDNDGSFSFSKTIEVDISSITGVEDEVNYRFSLKQNYPNPFNPTTTIKYSIAKENKVELKVYDILGSEVKMLESETKAPGNYKVQFNGSSFASGIYFYRLKSGNQISTKKLMLVK